MLIVQHLTYLHPDRTLLFNNLNFSIATRQKVSLIGNNGCGKSTLLRLIANELPLTSGHIASDEKPFYVPQILPDVENTTIAGTFGLEEKLKAYYHILAGQATEEQLLLLDDDWEIEDRCMQALHYWGLQQVDLFSPLAEYSGGERTKILLAGMLLHHAKFIVLDEPSNHLDDEGRELLYTFIKETTSTLLIVSHDRELLNLMNHTLVLNTDGIESYGGNYGFYMEQRAIAKAALAQTIQSKEKALRKAKDKEKETLERQQRLDARGKRKQEKAGVSRIMMNTLRNNAELSTSKVRATHGDKINTIKNDLSALRTRSFDASKVRFGFTDSNLHRGKILLEIKEVNITYNDRRLWSTPISLQIRSGERISLKGSNGSGKTTLIKMLLGTSMPQSGEIIRQTSQFAYIDQDYSLLRNSLMIYEQAQSFNKGVLEEHEVKTRLDQFLFEKDSWGKRVETLSGGERMRLCICCLTLNNTAPDLMVLDEPTNNLDIESIDILTQAINQYVGSLIVVSHDQAFIRELGINRKISLSVDQGII